MVDDRITACTFTKDGNVIAVATKSSNVIFRPLDCKSLILDAVIANSAVVATLLQVSRCQEPEKIEAVVKGHNDNRVVGGLSLFFIASQRGAKKEKKVSAIRVYGIADGADGLDLLRSRTTVRCTYSKRE